MNDFYDVVGDNDIPEQRNSNGRLEGDEHTTVIFYRKAVQNKAKSAEEGRPMFGDEYFISIKTTIDPLSQIFTYASEDYKKRFPKDWDRFINEEGASQEGTPLEHYKGVTKAKAAEMRAQGIYTVEALADLVDSAASRFGFLDFKKKAQNYLAVTKEDAIALKSAENAKAMAEMQRKNDEMAAMMALMQGQLATLSGKKKAEPEPEYKDVDAEEDSE